MFDSILIVRVGGLFTGRIGGELILNSLALDQWSGSQVLMFIKTCKAVPKLSQL